MTDDDIIGREVELTYTWNITVLPGQTPVEALREYLGSVGFAFDEPSSVKDAHTGESLHPWAPYIRELPEDDPYRVASGE